MTLGLHNKLAIRGRSSSVHIDLLNRLQSEGESVIELLSNLTIIETLYMEQVTYWII